jgi:hypothetical protein
MSSGASLPANPTPAYSFQSQPQADAGAMGGINTQAQTTQNVNNLYNSGASTQAGSNLTQASNTPLGYQGQALATGFDPQNQLYAQQYQQNQDQTNVANAQNGVANTPYGAGIAAQSNQNFDTNWQNQQLQRQNTAANTASTLGSTAGNEATTGTAVGQSVPQFSTSQQQQTIQDFLSYLQGGSSATNAGTSQYGAESSAALGQQAVDNQALGGLGSLLGTLGGAAIKYG